MSTNTTLLQLIDLVQAELPTVARQVLESTSQALKANPRHFGLSDAWSRRRARFAMEFETELRPALARLRQGDAAERSRTASFEGLSLVDEHQALRDVAIAHVVELCNEASRTELFQLGNFFVALRGGVVAGRDSNALRPALFARALVNALAGADLSAEAHYALVRVAAPGLAAALQPLYQRLAAALREANLTQLVSTRPGQERPRRRDARDSQSGVLADWHARSQAVQTQPAALIPATPEPSPLAQLYQRILDDPQLGATVKAQLARLRQAVTRLSADDPSLLQREDHPTWRLINAVAAYASGFRDLQDKRLVEFLSFLQEQTQALVDAPHPSAEQFAYLLRLVDAFIARQARERSQPNPAELAALQREQQRGPWLLLLREQLQAQIGPARLEQAARRFLLGPWAEAIVQAMVTEGHEGPGVQALLQLVDELVDSLWLRGPSSDRNKLREALPALVKRIEAALQAVALSEARRNSLLQDLMQLHGRVLSGQAQAETQAEAASSKQPDEAEVSRFVEERDSAFSSIWAHAQVDRAALPTQPLPLQDTQPSQLDEAHVWLDQLAIGGWFHLFVDGNWETVQLVWIGGDRRMFLFVAQDGEHRHTLTEGALTYLYLNGLAMYLEQEGLVERAANTLMQDLGG
jgi:hypothetical protein